MTGRSDAERAALLRELYTGAVADILDELGHREQCLPADIRPLLPEMKVAGPVYTRSRVRRRHGPALRPDGHVGRHLSGRRGGDRCR